MKRETRNNPEKAKPKKKAQERAAAAAAAARPLRPKAPRRAAAPRAVKWTARVCVAQIGAAHGVRGEVRLKSFTADPLGVDALRPARDRGRHGAFEIEAVRPAKDMLVARLKGVADRNAAEALTNLRLYVRARAAAAARRTTSSTTPT